LLRTYCCSAYTHRVKVDQVGLLLEFLAAKSGCVARFLLKCPQP